MASESQPLPAQDPSTAPQQAPPPPRGTDTYEDAWPPVRDALTIYMARMVDRNRKEIARRDQWFIARLRERYPEDEFPELDDIATESLLNPPPSPALFAKLDDELMRFCKDQLPAGTQWPGLPREYMALMRKHNGIAGWGFRRRFPGGEQSTAFGHIDSVLTVIHLFWDEMVRYCDEMPDIFEMMIKPANMDTMLCGFRCANPDDGLGAWWFLVRLAEGDGGEGRLVWVLSHRRIFDWPPEPYDSVVHWLTNQPAENSCLDERYNRKAPARP